MNSSAAIVLAAGLGTRMKSSLPKVMHKIASRPMVNHVIDNLQSVGVNEIICVIGPDMPALSQALSGYKLAIQTERLGTAHAVMAAKEQACHITSRILIAFGDTPLIRPETFERLLNDKNNVSVLGFTPDDAGAYGRLVVNAENQLEAIVEYKDATDVQRKITLCNSGVMCVDGVHLFPLLEKIDNKNAAGEYYLTDIVALARKAGLSLGVVEGDEDELLGVNSRLELARAEGLYQMRLREQAMIGGATLLDPNSTYFSYDTLIGKDVIIEPNVFFGPKVVVKDNVHIKAFSHLEDTTVGEKVIMGPYARLRPGTKLENDVKVGNFVEIKNAHIAEGAKVNHLSYIGDAKVGKDANIGAGTITCNYDGYFKYQTIIGEGAFIGSNTALVAPVTVGDNANIGAGSVISKDVEGGALSLTRAPQKTYAKWAEQFRARQTAEKAKKK